MKKNLKISPVCLILIGIILIHVFILTKIIFFPYPELFIYSYLTTKGLLPYAQIIDQHFPGLMFFPVNLYSLGMTTAQRAFAISIFIVIINQILIYLVAKKLFKSGYKAIFANFLYLLWHPYLEGYVLWIDSFVSLILLASFYLFVSGTQKKKDFAWVFAALLLGISLVFKQVVIPLIGLILLYFVLIKRNINYLFKLILGISVPVLLMLFYFIKIGVWRDFFYWTVTFNLTTFAKMGRKLPSLIEMIKIFWIFGPIVLAIIFFSKWKKNKEFMLLGLFLLGTLPFFYARADFVHLQPALPFLVISIAYLTKFIPKKVFLSGFIIYLAGSVYLLVPFYRWANYYKTEMFFGATEKKVAYEVKRYADKDESVFPMATISHLNFLTDTLPPGRVFVFPFPWFMQKAQGKILDGLLGDPPKVIVLNKNATVQGMNLVSYMPEIMNFVDKYYKVVNNIEGNQILIPK